MNLGNGKGGKNEVVGEELEASVALGIVIVDAAESVGIGRRRLDGGSTTV